MEIGQAMFLGEIGRSEWRREGVVDRLPLATFNSKDYADFAEYDGLRLVDVS